MKRIAIYILAVFFCQSTWSQQSVGIGTTTPNPKAILDINSTTKGLLIPSMTTSQRTLISSPPNGLMVYDIDRNEFYHSNGGSWSPILNGDYWSRPIASRKRITNVNDSVGIGTISPTEWLDVDGNIRSRNNMLVDNNLYATGAVQGGSLVSTGNLVAIGTGLFNSDLQTNSILSVNNSSATLNLKASSVDKGFVQLSGDNLRLGTYSSNSNGRIILRSGGTDRMTIFENGNVNIGSTASNAAKLRVSGDLSVQDNVSVQNDINLLGRITRTNLSGSLDLLPFCFGSVLADGTINSGSGNFTVQKTSTGVYVIYCTGVNEFSVYMATAGEGGRFASAYVHQIYSDAFVVKTFDVDGTNNYRDTRFSFMVYKGN